MDEPKGTSVWFKAHADFQSIQKTLAAYRRSLAATKAAEKAFNATSNKDRAAATKITNERTKALTNESKAWAALAQNVKKYAAAAKTQPTSVKNVTKQILDQNKILQTNATRLRATAKASKEYNDAQQRTAKVDGPSKASADALKREAAALRNVTDTRDASVRALKNETKAHQEAAKARVRFVAEVGHVNEATGEVLDTSDRVAKSTTVWSQALARSRSFLSSFTQNAEASKRAQEMVTRARERQREETERVTIAEINLERATSKFGSGSSQAVVASVRLERARRRLTMATESYSGALTRMRKESNMTTRAMDNIGNGSNRLYRSLERFGNWRPRLTPPFVALIPIIGSVVAAINPLVALLGTLGPVALGLASSIGSLSGAFLALPGILSAVASGIGSVIASMGGVGNVFKTYSAMQKAINTGNSNESQSDRAEALADAEYNLGKAQKNVKRAQEDLNRARKEALRDLVALRLEVSRASLNEEEAIANLTLAREEYNNVMADPASTKGDKQRAAADIKRAEADLADVRKQNKENQEALNKAEKDGIEGSERVTQAKENLAEANRSVMLAERGIRDARKGDAQVAQSTNAYQEALDKLSPSARAFALAIIGMQDQWKAFRRTIQEDFFSGFVNELDRLPSLLKTLESFLRPSAKAMGRFTGELMRLLDSPEWKSDIASIGESNGRILNDLGGAFLNIATAIKDIMIAAQPFTEWMTGGFKDATANFRDFVEDGRESGKLAKWLDRVRGSLQKWGDIVGNVASTLYNYSAASSSFGDWLTDGLLDMTAGWKDASEEARKAGSPWQNYLNNIKPLLTEVKGLFGDFFGWLQDEMMSKENIDGAFELVRVIRDDLGPALSRLLDTLASTDIDILFVEAVSSIIDSIDTILENGGSAAFEAFFSGVTGFFGTLAEVLKKIPKPVLEGLLTFLGFLAAASFVGKFTGLTALLGKIPGAVDNAKKLWGYFKNIDGAKFASILGKTGLIAALAGVAVSAGTTLQTAFDRKDMIEEQVGKGDWKGAKETATKDGGIFKDLFPTMPLVNSVLSFLGLDSWNTELDNWMSGISGWMWDELPLFFAKFQIGWERGWNNIFAWFDRTFVVPVQTAWINFVLFFTRDIPKFFADIGLKFRLGWTAIRLWFESKFVTPFKNAWTNIQLAAQVAFKWIDTNVFAPFKTAGNAIVTAFTKVRDGLGTVWEGVKNKFKDPINFVIQEVYNNGIRKFWNGVADMLGLKDWKLAPAATIGGTPSASKNGAAGMKDKNGRPVNKGQFATGGVLPGYTPGRDVHTFHSSTGGTLQLSGGEAIMRPEWTKAVGGPRAVERMNRKARSGGTQAFAGGGIFDFFGNPAKYVTDGMKNLISGPLNAFASKSPYNKMLGAMPGQIISKLANFASKNASASKNDSGYSGGENLGWAKQWQIIKSALPWVQMTGRPYRPGDPRSRMHSMGRAIDLTPSMAVFNWIKQNYPNSQALIYSPAGGQQLYNGRNYMWGEPERSMHYNHVHWAMKNGGVLPNLYDRGGWLQPNDIGINRTGKPEAVLDPMESRALKSLLSGGGLGTLPALNAAVPALPSLAGVSGGDYSVHIGEYNVHNPVPERASDSLPKSIRKIAYMNQSRG